MHKAFPKAQVEGVFAQPISSTGQEVILGFQPDVQFVAIMLLGSDGVWMW